MNQRGALFACVIALAALLPASARAQIPGTANIQVGGTNIIGGTSGRCLYDNAGKIGETASCGLAGGITVGTSVITGGTTTRVLFDNAGVLGEYTAAQLSSFMGLGTASTQNTGTSGATVPLLSTANTWSLAQTFTTAPVFTDQSGSRTALGLGTVATQTYVELPWTPTYVGTGTAGTGQTYAIQSGSYERIGRQVTIRWRLKATSLGTAAGNIQIGGIPLAPVGDVGPCLISFYTVAGLAASTFAPTGNISATAVVMDLYQGNSTTSTAITVAQAGGAIDTIGSCTYRAS